MIPVFDGHNDTLLVLLENPDRDFGERAATGHLDVPRAREGGLVGGLFAMFSPDRGSLAAVVDTKVEDRAPFGPLDPDLALRLTLRMWALLLRLQDAGHLRVATTADEVEVAMADGVLAAVPHLEGAEAIPRDLEALHVLHRLGLRSLGPVWSRPNAFASGVPFAFPGSPDIGPGLTADGHRLVEECDRLRILLDVSHLNERGFWDLLQRSERPVAASHSNAHALCASARNLTDAQLDALAERDGLVGLNFASGFLREDGRDDPDVPLDTLVRHLDHLVARMGEDRVALGSDFDGATLPRALGDVTGLPRLLDALREHGWNDAALEKLAHRNWLALLRRVQEG